MLTDGVCVRALRYVEVDAPEPYPGAATVKNLWEGVGQLSQDLTNGYGAEEEKVRGVVVVVVVIVVIVVIVVRAIAAAATGCDACVWHPCAAVFVLQDGGVGGHGHAVPRSARAAVCSVRFSRFGASTMVSPRCASLPLPLCCAARWPPPCPALRSTTSRCCTLAVASAPAPSPSPSCSAASSVRCVGVGLAVVAVVVLALPSRVVNVVCRCVSPAGVDKSESNVRQARIMQHHGQQEYERVTEGIVTETRLIRVPAPCRRPRAFFVVCDATELTEEVCGVCPPSYTHSRHVRPSRALSVSSLSLSQVLRHGPFDLIVMDGLLTRVTQPLNLLNNLVPFLAARGVLVVSSDNDWDPAFTPRNSWLGGFKVCFGFGTASVRFMCREPGYGEYVDLSNDALCRARADERRGHVDAAHAAPHAQEGIRVRGRRGRAAAAAAPRAQVRARRHGDVGLEQARGVLTRSLPPVPVWSTLPPCFVSFPCDDL